MAKLVDALVSGTSSRKAVQVRVLFRAHEVTKNIVNNSINNVFFSYRNLFIAKWQYINMKFFENEKTNPLINNKLTIPPQAKGRDN